MLDTDIKFLQGVGPNRAKLLQKELNIKTFRDLLFYFPFRYVDKSRIYTVKEINSATEELPLVQLKGKIIGFKIAQAQQNRLSATFQDETGMLDLVWFKGVQYLQKSIKTNSPCIIFGKPTIFNGRYNIVHPEIEDLLQEKNKISSNIQAIYSSTGELKNNSLTNKSISRMQSTLLTAELPHIAETLPPYLIEQNHLLNLQDALLNIHFPQSLELLQQAQYRLKLEDLFYLELQLLRQRNKRINESKGFVFSKVSSYFNNFYSHALPFELTNAQKRVIKEIYGDMKTGKQMNRLLQGDVGSGKTIVALLCALLAADNGFQSCIMAPTEILANQHYTSIKEQLHNTDFEVGLLTGSTKKSERKVLFEQLLGGQLQLLIGTHALIEDSVQFARLGLVIIDEQHRFGVEQRGRLWNKTQQQPHVLVMTATPIPRTLAMTLYGDLDTSVIDDLPPGRKPIRTLHYTDGKRVPVYHFLQEQIEAGRQIYIVYPLIKESEKMDYKNLQDGYEQICERFPQYKTGIVHGKMKAAEKEAAMQAFQQGKTNIMVATSVIEVGVNVPNASVMIIESSERFGLAQMHQLRGRVGRGAEQSYCILMSGVKLSRETRQRLNMMCSTNNGFEIAEADLQLRGYGDMDGTRQSGLSINLKIAHLAQDAKLLELGRNIAEKILTEDPSLASERNSILLQEMQRIHNQSLDYSLII
jgi:ATP-dependent DNA helicase RecG